MYNKVIVKELMNKYQSSFFLYSEEIIKQQINILQQHLSDFEIFYSLKTNPFKPIVSCILNNGCGADAASSFEVECAHDLGVPYKSIMYSAPGKTRQDIESTIEKALIIADSYHELKLINDIAKQKKIKVKVGLRVNPNYSINDDKGTKSKFGIDKETLFESLSYFHSLSYLEIIGLHIHLKSQVLDESTLLNYYENTLKLASKLHKQMGWVIEFINFGGGLGVAYSLANDKKLNVEKLGVMFQNIQFNYPEFHETRLIIESGRFIVCESGYYASPIVDIKKSHETIYYIVKNGLNGFMRPAIAQLLMQYSTSEKLEFGLEPIYTAVDAFEFSVLDNDNNPLQLVDVVGRLCTAADVMATDIMLPCANIGDILLISKAGSYAYSLTPLLFSSLEQPLQFYLTMNNEILT